MNYTELCDTAAPAYSSCNGEYLYFPMHASLLITAKTFRPTRSFAYYILRKKEKSLREKHSERMQHYICFALSLISLEDLLLASVTAREEADSYWGFYYSSVQLQHAWRHPWCPNTISGRTSGSPLGQLVPAAGAASLPAPHSAGGARPHAPQGWWPQHHITLLGRRYLLAPDLSLWSCHVQPLAPLLWSQVSFNSACMWSPANHKAFLLSSSYPWHIQAALWKAAFKANTFESIL